MINRDDSDRPIRRWCGLGLGAIVLFAVYVSLVPFSFVELDRSEILLALSQAVHVGIQSKADWLSNLVLFVPVGFLGSGLLDRKRASALSRVLASIGLLITAFILSTLIEAAQIFAPGRTSSAADVAAQSVGVLCGLAAWFALSPDIRQWSSRLSSIEDRARAGRRWLTLYSLGYMLLLLWPLDVTFSADELVRKYRSGGVVINPLSSPAFTFALLPPMISDFILAMPIGIACHLIGVASDNGRSRTRSALFAAIFFGAAEVAQVFILSCRADVGEFLIGAAGAVTGIGFYTALRPTSASGRAGRQTATSVLPVLGLLLSAFLYLTYNWIPFDFQLSGDFARERGPRLFAMPFYGYYVNPGLKALADGLLKLTMSAPLGVFLAGWLDRGVPSHHRRAAPVLAFACIVGFFCGVEIGQVFLPSRFPDNSDIILATVGALVGWRLSRRTGERNDNYRG